MMKRACGILLLLLGLMGFAAEALAEETISVWAWGYNVGIAQNAGAAYTAKHPEVSVHAELYLKPQIYETLNTAFLSGNYDQLPNIVLIEDDEAQAILQRHQDEFVRLDAWIDPDIFIESKAQFATMDGALCGMPFDVSVCAMFYREDVLAAAGYTAEDIHDLTWDRLIEIGHDVKAATGMNLLSIDPAQLLLLRTMLQSANSWYIDRDDPQKIFSDVEGFDACFDTYLKLLRSGLVVFAADEHSYHKAYRSGQVFCMIDGSWNAAMIANTGSQAGKWRAHAIPVVSGVEKSTAAAQCGGSSWYVLKNVEGAELAVDFLIESFAADNAVMERLVETNSHLSALRSSRAMPYYQTTSEYFGGEALYTFFYDRADAVPEVFYGIYTDVLEEAAFDAIDRILLGDESQKALAYAVQAVRTELPLE